MNAVLNNLYERKLNVDLHRPIIDEDSGAATFILYSLNGNILGYHQYRPFADKKNDNNPKTSKYYTYRIKTQIPFWGAESYYINDGPIFLTEGIFDGSRLTYRGQTCFSVLCNNPSPDLKNFFKMLPRPVVAICDNNSAGMKLKKFGDYFEVVDKFNDLGDSDEEYVTYIIEKYRNPFYIKKK